MEFNKTELLSKFQDALKDEMVTIAYDTWIKPLKIRSIKGNKIVLEATSDFQKETIENRYFPLVFNTFKYLTNKEWEIEVINGADLQKSEELSNQEESSSFQVSDEIIKANNSTLNPDFTFETFIEGNNNRLARAAAISVSENPAKTFNPLFLYGGVGLGKTHLMHAIGNRIRQNDSSKNVLYVTSEEFTNQIINAILNGKTKKFRDKYRHIDVLLIDDIQFIADKESVQEEFFHTFEALRNTGKQIVLTSDKPPKDIALLTERLRSRFSDGLIADISQPSYETRLAILRKKVQEERIVIDDDILAHIANSVDSNIRELNGVLTKVVVMAQLMNSPITLEMAERCINEFIASNDKVITSDYIIETVANYFDKNASDLTSTKRSNDIAIPRQIAMYLCRTVLNMSYKDIAKAFKKKDHSTIIHAFQKMDKEINENSDTKLVVNSIKKIIERDKS